MPIYEYQCDGCGEVFEVRQKMSDPPPAGHTCGAKSVKRILSNTSFVLKGTGWYKTDYAQPKDGPAGQGAKDAEPKAKADAKADSKPASSGDASSPGAAGAKPPPKSGGDGGGKPSGGGGSPKGSQAA